MSDFIEVCEKAARRSGAILTEMLGRVEVREKGRADLVTEADFASQEAIREAVLEAFPDHSFLGEEQGAGFDRPGAYTAPAESEYRWIADPLDGTTNYVHQVPHFSVSLALEHRGKLLAGCVFDPILDECFLATSGGGAQLNGKAIQTSRVSSLSKSLAAVGFAPGCKGDSAELRMFLRGLERCQALRRTGSAALNLAYVAAGRFDASWSMSTKIWDVAAGVLLIREAGGLVTAPDGGRFCLDEGRFLVAANDELHALLVAMSADAGV